MKQSLSPNNSDDKSGIVQFFGKVDNQNFREFRVRMASLANTTGDRSINGTVQVGLKKTIEYHNNQISELEKQLQYHKLMLKSWNTFQRSTNEHNMELIARLLESSPEVIQKFESENFASNESWTQTRKAANGAEMKSFLSAVRSLHDKGNEVPEQKPKASEIEKAPNVSMSISKVCEDTTLTMEKLELTVRGQPDRQKDDDLNQEFSTLLVVKDDAPKVDEQENSEDNGVTCHEEFIKKSAPSDVQSEKTDREKDDEQAEKWSETASSEPHLGNTETSCSSLGSCEFEAGDDELNSPPLRDTNSPQQAEDVKKVKPVETVKKTNGNNRGKGKKGRKPVGPKMTIEEIEAIKKLKKDASDKAFAEREKLKTAHLEKVAKTDRRRTHRRCAETALEILKNGNGVLPPEIQDLNEMLEKFLHDTRHILEERYVWSREYLSTRPADLAKTITGQELEIQLHLLAAYEHLIERSTKLQEFLCFPGIFEGPPELIKEFEERTIALYSNGFDEAIGRVNERTEVEFALFKKECFDELNEAERLDMAVTSLEVRFNDFKKIGQSRTLTNDEKFTKEAYIGIKHLLEAFEQSVNVTAFLQKNRTHYLFNLMEAWFLESRKPPSLHR